MLTILTCGKGRFRFTIFIFDLSGWEGQNRNNDLRLAHRVWCLLVGCSQVVKGKIVFGKYEVETSNCFCSLDYFGNRRTDTNVSTKFQGVETPSQSRSPKISPFELVTITLINHQICNVSLSCCSGMLATMSGWKAMLEFCQKPFLSNWRRYKSQVLNMTPLDLTCVDLRLLEHQTCFRSYVLRPGRWFWLLCWGRPGD